MCSNLHRFHIKSCRVANVLKTPEVQNTCDLLRSPFLLYCAPLTNGLCFGNPNLDRFSFEKFIKDAKIVDKHRATLGDIHASFARIARLQRKIDFSQFCIILLDIAWNKYEDDPIEWQVRLRTSYTCNPSLSRGVTSIIDPPTSDIVSRFSRLVHECVLSADSKVIQRTRTLNNIDVGEEVHFSYCPLTEMLLDQLESVYVREGQLSISSFIQFLQEAQVIPKLCSYVRARHIFCVASVCELSYNENECKTAEVEPQRTQDDAEEQGKCSDTTSLASGQNTEQGDGILNVANNETINEEQVQATGFPRDQLIPNTFLLSSKGFRFAYCILANDVFKQAYLSGCAIQRHTEFTKLLLGCMEFLDLLTARTAQLAASMAVTKKIAFSRKTRRRRRKQLVSATESTIQPSIPRRAPPNIPVQPRPQSDCSSNDQAKPVYRLTCLSNVTAHVKSNRGIKTPRTKIAIPSMAVATKGEQQFVERQRKARDLRKRSESVTKLRSDDWECQRDAVAGSNTSLKSSKIKHLERSRSEESKSSCSFDNLDHSESLRNCPAVHLNRFLADSVLCENII